MIHETQTNKDNFRFSRRPKISYVEDNDPIIKRTVINSIEILSGRRKLERVYDNVIEEVDMGRTFWESAVEKMDLDLRFDRSKLDNIPNDGPVIFIANHPYGVLDGLAICYLASQVRDEFKIMINKALCKEERLDEFLLPIDFEDSKEARRSNVQSKRDAMATLKNGGAIVIFPAGGISTADKPFGPVYDLEWKLFTSKMIQMSKATVVPMFFHGQNGPMFQIMSQFSQTLRLSMIIREVNKQRGGTFEITIGDHIPFEKISHIKKREQLTLYLRELVYGLGNVYGEDAMRHGEIGVRSQKIIQRIPRPNLKRRFSKN